MWPIVEIGDMVCLFTDELCPYLWGISRRLLLFRISWCSSLNSQKRPTARKAVAYMIYDNIWLQDMALHIWFMTAKLKTTLFIETTKLKLWLFMFFSYINKLETFYNLRKKKLWKTIVGLEKLRAYSCPCTYRVHKSSWANKKKSAWKFWDSFILQNLWKIFYRNILLLLY